MFSAFRAAKNRQFFIYLFAAVLWLVYAVVGPGDEFFNGYRSLVLSPNDLIPKFGHPIMFNPPWLAPILAPFITMPGRSGYILFLGFTLGAILVSSEILKGKPFLVLISAQLFWILWWGQIDALAILGVALGWAALQRKSWKLLALAILLGALKPQISAAPLLAICWWIGRDRWKSLAVFAGMLLVTWLIYGPWPVWILEGVLWVTRSTQYEPWNSSIGLIGLPLFLPAILLKLGREQRLLALTATCVLVSPYMPYYSTAILLVFNLPWWMLAFALIGYFPNLLGTSIAWNGIVFLPISILGLLYFPWAKSILQRITAVPFLHSKP